MDWWHRGSRVGRPVESVGARVGALVFGAGRAAGAGCARAAHLRQPKRQGGARASVLHARRLRALLRPPGRRMRRARAARAERAIPETRVVGPRIVVDASEASRADAGREDSRDGGANAANRRSVRLVGPSVARTGEALHAAEVGATQNAASPAPSCATVIPSRRDYTYPRWRKRYGGLKADDAKGPVRPGSATRRGPCRRRHAEKRPASGITTWSLRRFRGSRFGAQEVECSP